MKVEKSRLAAAVLIAAFITVSLLTTGCTVRRTGVLGHPVETAQPGERIHTYFLKQKIWTAVDKFTIKDQANRPLFYIKGKFFTIGKKLSFRDMDGNELLYIKQKLLSFENKYRFYRDSQRVAQMVKKIAFFKNKYVLRIEEEDDIKIVGDVLDYSYAFIRNGRKVAHVSKKVFSWSDTYRIDVAEGEDDVLILAAAVVIDLVAHNQEHHHSNP